MHRRMDQQSSGLPEYDDDDDDDDCALGQPPKKCEQLGIFLNVTIFISILAISLNKKFKLR